MVGGKFVVRFCTLIILYKIGFKSIKNVGTREESEVVGFFAMSQ